MTNEQLFIPRYEVIADFWDNPFPVGTIIVLNGMYKINEKEKRFFHDGFGGTWYEHEFSDYPHLFRLMHWSEQRNESDLPDYVKYEINGTAKVENILDRKNEFQNISTNHLIRLNCLPATEEEFNEYKVKIS